MKNLHLNLTDYLFLQFRTVNPTLNAVVAIYYPHLSKAKVLEKARKQEFPFACFRIDDSQKSPYIVDITDLAYVLESNYQNAVKDYEAFHSSAVSS